MPILKTSVTSAALFCAVHSPAFGHDNQVEVTQQGERTCIASNGAPNHEMGRFPNRANPNAFREQNLTFCFPAEPELAAQNTEGLMTVGVSVTGVPIRPYTAGYYDEKGRRGFSQDPASGWRQQAMHNPQSLGMDDENGHVDKAGLYHYHGVASGLLETLDDTVIGYAPDGFTIRYDPSSAVSSWRLKAGNRATPPFGAYDGTFEQDFEYVAGSGTLDECNGALVDGTYTYFATDTYPHFPRCFKGVIEGRFLRRN